MRACSACAHFFADGDAPDASGACRRYPPGLTHLGRAPNANGASPGVLVFADFPPVRRGWSCGEFRYPAELEPVGPAP